MTSHEFGKEVLGFRLLRLIPVSHYVTLLLPDLDRLLQLHLSLDNQHVDDAHILDILVLHELLLQLVADLLD